MSGLWKAGRDPERPFCHLCALAAECTEAFGRTRGKRRLATPSLTSPVPISLGLEFGIADAKKLMAGILAWCPSKGPSLFWTIIVGSSLVSIHSGGHGMWYGFPSDFWVMSSPISGMNRPISMRKRKNYLRSNGGYGFESVGPMSLWDAFVTFTGSQKEKRKATQNGVSGGKGAFLGHLGI